MAMVVTMAVLYHAHGIVTSAVCNHQGGCPMRAKERHARAEQLVAEIFDRAGWKVRVDPNQRAAGRRPDLVVRHGRVSYAVEVKVAPEGRSDRLVPLWSQACLEALRAAGKGQVPLAVVAAPHVPPRVAENVLEFAGKYGGDAAAGVIDFEGLRVFRGAGLDQLSAGRQRSSRLPQPSNPVDLFSDLNQWMLKVLLAPEIPEALLSAPRGRYNSASDLARAADVSVMSASRFIRSLQEEGHWADSGPRVGLVRRPDLFRRWQAWSASRPVREVPMRFLLRGDPNKELRRVLRKGQACLGLFAAADALGLGFVSGVPPHLYVEQLRPRSQPHWRNVVRAERGEAPDFILRSAPAAQSVFRGAVEVDGERVSDVLQVWLDVSAHPSRGREQANLIRSRVLDQVIKEAHGGG